MAASPPDHDYLNPVKVDIPPIENRRDLVNAFAAVVQAVGAGKLAPGEGSAVAALLANIARFIDDAEVEARIRSLEKELKDLQVDPPSAESWKAS
jgi:hypothetical protein